MEQTNDDKNELYSGQATHVFGELLPYITDEGLPVPHIVFGRRFRCTSWKQQNIISTNDNIELKGQGVFSFLCILVREDAR